MELPEGLHRADPPQWGHGPEAVETSGAAARRRPVGGPQWGHGPEAVETTENVESAYKKDEPQWGHGPEAVETGALTGPPPLAQCRNGATALRPWRHSFDRDAKSRWCCRNGATALRPWRHPQPGDLFAVKYFGPQWGHGPEAVETIRLFHKTQEIDLPQWGHGPEAVETTSAFAPSGFGQGCRNGATALRPWRPAPAGHPQLRALAAMGPRP